jgi:hypothetical protein
MRERTNIPSLPACGQWEALLADALDGLLKPEDEAVFAAHMAACPECAALFEEARRGREWLEFLSPEPEVPAGLLDKILAKTGPGQEASYGLMSGGAKVVPIRPVTIPAWQRPGLMSHVRRFAEPRLLMTAAMAFFSIAMTLNLTGVRLSDLKLSNLRPSMVRSIMERRLTMASTPIIRYYDHSRLVREVQMKVQELRPATQGEGQENRAKPQESTPGESNKAAPRQKIGAPAESPQQSASPAAAPTLNDTEFMETSLTFQGRFFTPASKTWRRGFEPAHSIGSAMEEKERSTAWTA